MAGLAVPASLGLVGGSARATPPHRSNSDENWFDVLGPECEKLDEFDIPG